MFLINRSPNESQIAAAENINDNVVNMSTNNTNAPISSGSDDINPFQRTTITGHSPKLVEKPHNRSSVNPVLTRSSTESPLKRKSDGKIERSIEDVYNFMINMNQQSNNNFSSLETKMTKGFSDLENRVNIRMDGIDEKIEIISQKTDNNTKLINWMQQERLQNKMEIDGLKIQGTIDRSTIKETTVKLLYDMGIKVDFSEIKSTQIKHVSISKTVKTTKPIIVVEFENLDAKIRVMRHKKSLKGHPGIFFDNCLTPLNRSLMGKLKKITKPKNFSVYIQNNKIYAKKSKELFHAIECEEDLETVAAWPANVKSTVSETNDPSSSSSLVTSKK